MKEDKLGDLSMEFSVDIIEADQTLIGRLIQAIELL